jgi:hypothetical protein
LGDRAPVEACRGTGHAWASTGGSRSSCWQCFHWPASASAFVRRDWAEIGILGALVAYLVIGVVVYSATIGDNTGHACIHEDRAGRCTAFEDVPRRNDPNEAGDVDTPGEQVSAR